MAALGGALASTARMFRFEAAGWRRIVTTSTMAGAGLVVSGAYLLFAFDRFGIQGLVEARATARLLLTGLYGWLGLALGTWLVARLAWQQRPSFEPVLRLFGHAHIPLLVVGAVIQFVSVALRVSGVVLWLALVAVLVWMPAQLIAASEVSLELGKPQAALTVLGPYVAWLVVVGRWLETQLSHLL